MNSRIHIQSELEELNSSLPFNVKMPVFNVPEGYFESFADGVLALVKGKQAVSPSDELTDLSPLLAGISRKMPFSVPENYFDETALNLPAITEEERLPQFLSVAGKSMPYEVPVGFFEAFPQQVLDKVARPKARVISFNRKWMRYAAVAILAGIVVLSSIVYFSGNKVDPVHEPGEWVALKLKNVSTQELDAFIKTASIVNGTEMAKNGTKADVQQMLKNVPDNELDAFLNQMPSGNADDLWIN